MKMTYSALTQCKNTKYAQLYTSKVACLSTQVTLPKRKKPIIYICYPISPVIHTGNFNVNGSVNCKNIPIYIQQDTLHSFTISGNCSTCFGWYHHPSPGVHTTVLTASGICHTVIAACRCRGRVGTPTLPR